MSNSNEDKTLADRLLQAARDSRWPLSVYLVSGFQLKGEIVDFDHETILINHKSAKQLVMRSGGASMYPLPSSSHDVDGWWKGDNDKTATKEQEATTAKS